MRSSESGVARTRLGFHRQRGNGRSKIAICVGRARLFVAEISGAVSAPIWAKVGLQEIFDVEICLRALEIAVAIKRIAIV